MSDDVQRDDQSTGMVQGGSQFHTTRWSVVLAAGKESAADRREALSRLCETYWYPLYVFARRQGHNANDAQDLTQAFFAKLLERDDLAGLKPDRGKFRAFLLAAMRNFLANDWDRSHAQKRGGDRCHFSIDFQQGEGRYAVEPADRHTPETLFERQWALTLLDLVWAKLRQQYEEAGQLALYQELQGCLTGDTSADSYKEIATRCDMTEGAVRVAVHRLRRRFGALLREEIFDTLENNEQTEDELRYLFTVLRS